ncbi:MAG TPA: thiamine-phosphate kinase [Longimicrobiales bacterium]|nr:thiamine-phosphate kinase [Longimicrobiales bacterium]
MKRINLGKGAEFDLIRQILAAGGRTEPSDAIRVGPGDDCAVVRGEGVALSVDMAVEGVHFRREWLEPEEIGYRAAAAALSDLAAMAASPLGILVALATPVDEPGDLARRIMEGAGAAAANLRAVLLGGDMTRTPGPVVVDVVVVGNTVRPVLRDGARPGDSLWVTGELGAAAAAVRSWTQGQQPEPAARLAYALPTPRVAEAGWLAAHNALDALLDISDGLAGDAGHMAAASGVRIILDEASIPVHPTASAVASGPDDALYLALAGGDDYELCFAAPPGAVERIRDRFMDTFDVALTRVGTVHEGSGVLLRDRTGAVNPLPYAGYDHFPAGDA